MRDDIRGGALVAERLLAGAPPAEVLGKAGPHAWLELDLAVRSWRAATLSLPSLDEVEGVRRSLRTRLRSPGPITESRLAVALCHPNGRVREAALLRAAAQPALLPLVVVRCTDWADPVRERARQVLRDTLTPDTAEALAPVILLVGRRDRGGFATELLADVLRRTPRARLMELLASPEREIRRFAHRLAVEQRLLFPVELARRAAHDLDPVVQSVCADTVLATVTADTPDDVLQPLLGARRPRVRAAGVTALRPAGRPERATPFLTDRSALVRACARYVVRQYGTDPLPLYRGWCSAGDPVPGAVIGLAECGERTDAGTLWDLLGHPSGAVRARAVAGLRVLDVTDVRRMRALLDDPAPGVVRETLRTLLPSARLLPGDWLLERAGDEHPAHVRRAALRLLERRGSA